MLALAAAVGCLGGCLAKHAMDQRFYDGYDPNLSREVANRGEELRPGYRRLSFSFDGLAGQPVPAVLALPPAGAGPFPCVVFLHGIGQDKGFLDHIAAPFTAKGFAFVSFDQYMRGERRLPKGASWPAQIRAFRQRAALTVIETRRLLDVLQARPDIAPDRLYLAGASYGAITGAVAAALDARFRAVVLIYGGGDLGKLFANKEIKDRLGVMYRPVVALACSYLAPSDPVGYVGAIAPRPVLFLNGTRDRLIPTAAAQALYDAAGQPKRMVWYDSDHVGLDHAHVGVVLSEVISWLLERDAERGPGPGDRRGS
jgi:dienelactone hydrolase